MIHGHKIKIKSSKEDLKEVEKELYDVTGQLRKGKGKLGGYKWHTLNEEKAELLEIKKKLKNKISRSKREIKKIKQKKKTK